MTDPHPTGGQHSLMQQPVPPPPCPLRSYCVHFTFFLMSPGFSLFLIRFFTKKLRNFPLFTSPLGFPFCPLLSSAAWGQYLQGGRFFPSWLQTELGAHDSSRTHCPVTCARCPARDTGNLCVSKPRGVCLPTLFPKGLALAHIIRTAR